MAAAQDQGHPKCCYSFWLCTIAQRTVRSYRPFVMNTQAEIQRHMMIITKAGSAMPKICFDKKLAFLSDCGHKV
jgi:hypothetical protein